MQPNDRSRLAFMIRYAMRHPGRIVPHARRQARDAVLRLRNRNHVSYYRAVMRSDAARRMPYRTLNQVRSVKFATLSNRSDCSMLI